MKTEQLSVSTADEERNYFSGSVQFEVPTQSGSTMPTGIYRFVDGLLYQVLPNAPTPPQSRPDGQEKRR